MGNVNFSLQVPHKTAETTIDDQENKILQKIVNNHLQYLLILAHWNDRLSLYGIVV